MILKPIVACSLATFALAAALAHAAHAQALDYTAAEAMLGEPVTMSVSGKPQRVSEAPADTTIVTAEQIRRTGANNLPDVLQFIPGLDVRRFGQQSAAIGIRGYNTALNPRVLVLLDGRQVYQDDYGFVVWSLIPVTMTEIRQIEIVRGPAAALYGFNAVSGVINIVTYDPLLDPVNGGFAQVGLQNTAYGEAVSTIRLPDRAGMRISVKGFRADEFANRETNAPQSRPLSGTAAVDARVRIADGVFWSPSVSFGSTQYDLFADVGYYFPASFKSNSIRSRLDADTPIGMFELDAYRNENRTAGENMIAQVNWRQNTTVVRASDVVKLGSDHVVRFAGEYRENTISSAESFSGRLSYSIVAGSAMWNWQISPTLSLTNAVRVDRLSLSHAGPQYVIPSLGGLYQSRVLTEPSFNSGAVLKLTPNDTVRISAARALQLPSLVDFGLVASTNPALIVAGNTNLRPAAVTNIEVDYDRALPALNSKLHLAVFGQRTDTTLGSPFGSGSTFLPTGQVALIARNFGSSREIGGELGLTGDTAGWRWNASYAFASVHDDTPDQILRQAASVNYQRLTPVHAVILGGGKTWDRFDVDLQARWQSHFQDFNTDLNSLVITPTTVPNYLTVNAQAAYRVTDNLTLSLTGQQLLQHRLRETGGLQVERRLLAGLRAQF